MAQLRHPRLMRNFKALEAACAELEVAKAQAEARSSTKSAAEQKVQFVAMVNHEMPARDFAPAGVSARAEALVDSERLADLRRGLPEGLFDGLVEQCLVDIRERMPQLRDALRAGSAAAANEVAHALAGMAGSYALTLFERRMRDIMVATAVNDMAVAATKAQGMESELDRSAELLRALLRAHAVGRELIGVSSAKLNRVER